MQTKRHKKKRPVLRAVLLSLFAVIIILGLIFSHFGGFSTGKSSNVEEFKQYAADIPDITIAPNVSIVALGEATHGNVEFQQLKLDVFKVMVEKYNVRAFALEGDFGGCQKVNRYIHGEEGSAKKAAEAIGFTIYRTQEMEDLITYMREYNEKAPSGDDIRFYGFDMQRWAYNYKYLVEECKIQSVQTDNLEKLVVNDEWSEEYSQSERKDVISQVKNELTQKDNSELAIHFADMLIQNITLGELSGSNDELILKRDEFMAQNCLWISSREESLGHARIFVSGHNGHIAKYASYDSMGKILSDTLGENYYAIGTDFYKTTVNIPNANSNKRVNRVFYSHDPLAKTAKLAGYDICWLDFSSLGDNSELKKVSEDYVYMGSLGEGFSILMRILPQAYRIFQPPAQLYNSMIFVTKATPIKVL